MCKSLTLYFLLRILNIVSLEERAAGKRGKEDVRGVFHPRITLFILYVEKVAVHYRLSLHHIATYQCESHLRNTHSRYFTYLS